ncbi:very long chain fatty acid elongase AAEL008004-like [Centruroides vittatus]|uniref:elongation of very long chain fatty acids protein AAEL008004-like n=1 Tax=Centruroides sculpturatus TaxID=218467 RepID=UPI000C6E8F64|nr:elongation of very long chain fatty acids protein AAEL008004-like [Centruroides sculpturatus]
MDHLWLEIVDFYNTTLDNGDPRVNEWPMMQSPWPTISICLLYVYVVKVLAPAYMKDREPMNIRTFMVVYNFLMVIVSFVTFYMLGRYGWFGKYNWRCQPVDYSDNEDAVMMVHIAWWYYLSKYLEFIDTFFFVLRRKFSHVSTLHVIHHGVMPMSVWWGVKFTPGGHSTFFAFINSFVHILMYIYYGLAAMGPSMYKYLWWKKYMTTVQMVQFIIIFIHSFQLLFNSQCNYPRGFMWWIGFHAVMFWFLFMDFYKSAYHKKRTTSKRLSESIANGVMHANEKTKECDGSVQNGFYQNGICVNGIPKKLVSRCNSNKKED